MTTINFPQRARRDDPHGYMTVQDNLDFLAREVAKGTGGGPPGPAGPIGPTGPAGPPGAGLATYTFTQSTPSATWSITHNLNTYPAVSVVDTGGTEIIPDILYASANSITLTFGSPTSGKAYLN